jgi:hypothetical protein
MTTYSIQVRQGWGCGYEPAAADGAPVMPWSGLGYSGPPPTVCPGYTTSLPETLEIARAWRWWSKSQLGIFVDGAKVHDVLKLGIELFDGVVVGFDRWKMTPRDKGGGAG